MKYKPDNYEQYLRHVGVWRSGNTICLAACVQAVNKGEEDEDLCGEKHIPNISWMLLCSLTRTTTSPSPSISIR
jgi:hypothetical protein